MQPASTTAPPTVAPSRAASPAPHYYYPAEGYGNLYRRVLTNDFFAALIGRSRIRTVAELPVDSYGIVGAGSLIFTQCGCDVTLVSDDQAVLERARTLMDFNRVDGVRYQRACLTDLPFAPDSFDFTWSFDRLQTLPDPSRFLTELCRVSKSTMVGVPNGANYGQLPHALYHRLTGTSCDYVGPRGWMSAEPIRDCLQAGGMAIVAEGLLDVPWWPGFPELPNLARRLIGRQPVELDHAGSPEVNPVVVSAADVPALRRRVARSARIEFGPWPSWVKRLFAHNLYVIGCKPQFRSQLAL